MFGSKFREAWSGFDRYYPRICTAACDSKRECARQVAGVSVEVNLRPEEVRLEEMVRLIAILLRGRRLLRYSGEDSRRFAQLSGIPITSRLRGLRNIPMLG